MRRPPAALDARRLHSSGPCLRLVTWLVPACLLTAAYLLLSRASLLARPAPAPPLPGHNRGCIATESERMVILDWLTHEKGVLRQGGEAGGAGAAGGVGRDGGTDRAAGDGGADCEQGGGGAQGSRGAAKGGSGASPCLVIARAAAESPPFRSDLNLVHSGTPPGARVQVNVTNRDLTIPSAVWAIRARLVGRERLEEMPQEPSLKDFIGIVKETGSFVKHMDGNSTSAEGEPLIHIRYNLFLSLPPEDKQACFYAGHRIEAQEGCYVLSLSGVQPHYCERNMDERPRVTLSMGFLATEQELGRLSQPPH